MNRDKMQQFLVFLIISGLLTLLALIGMVQIFKAADEARHSVKVTQCQNIVLGESVHNFHVAIAKIESLENNEIEKQRLVKEAINEPDIAYAMKLCEKR